ncbi:MAG: redoxin domain-containing protein [Sphingomonadales bacterium]|nr:redoxin domain-containing protein [Sphingomonadales bacterium]
MTLSIGQTAPDFTLFNDQKKEVALSSFKGKNVVLLFVPQAFTGVCTAELCQMRDSLHDYNNMNAEILAVSVDSVFTLEKWKKDESFNFNLLSDFNKEASRAYGSIYEEWIFGMKGVSKRSAFVIDKDGIIRYAEVLENPGEMPNLQAVKDTVAAL